MTDKAKMEIEARRVYCMFMRDCLQRSTGKRSSYGAGVMPAYDGTSTGRPRPGEAITHKSGRDYKPVWPKIAKCAQSNDVTILELVRAQFSTVNGLAPSATACSSQRAATTAVAFRDSAKQELFNLMASYMRIVEVQLRLAGPTAFTEKSAYSLLSLCAVSTLFKVNTLMLLGIESEITSNDIASAISDYLMRIDLYDSVWAKYIHPGFRNKALEALESSRKKVGLLSNNIIM